MDFDKKQLKHLADLAKLNISEEELSAYSKDLQGILAYVENINKLDLKDVPESIRGLKDEGIGPRPDAVKKSDIDSINTSVLKEGDYIAAPHVFNKK